MVLHNDILDILADINKEVLQVVGCNFNASTGTDQDYVQDDVVVKIQHNLTYYLLHLIHLVTNC